MVGVVDVKQHTCYFYINADGNLVVPAEDTTLHYGKDHQGPGHIDAPQCWDRRVENTYQIYCISSSAGNLSEFCCRASMCSLGCFSKDTLKKNKMYNPPHNFWVPRKIISRRRGWSNKSRGSPLTLKVWQHRRRWRIRRRPRIFVLQVLLLLF